MTEDEAREAWAKLETAMKHIHEQNASHLSFEELYRTAYTLVLHRHGQLLYSGFENSLRKHLHVVRAKFKDKSGVSFVTEVLAQWTSYHKSTQMIRDILMVCSSVCHADDTFHHGYLAQFLHSASFCLYVNHVCRCVLCKCTAP
jgi:Cullin family